MKEHLYEVRICVTEVGTVRVWAEHLPQAKDLFRRWSKEYTYNSEEYDPNAPEDEEGEIDVGLEFDHGVCMMLGEVKRTAAEDEAREERFNEAREFAEAQMESERKIRELLCVQNMSEAVAKLEAFNRGECALLGAVKRIDPAPSDQSVH
jgi:hypothetical protein